MKTYNGKIVVDVVGEVGVDIFENNGKVMRIEGRRIVIGIIENI